MGVEHVIAYSVMVYVLVILRHAQSGCSPGMTCPPLCICGPGGEVDCHGAGLQKVPSGFPADSTSILLADNNIEILEESDFESCFNLKYLDLSSNRISNVSKLAFRDVRLVETLHINNNKLRLDSNGSLAHGTFDQLTSLRELQIHNNSWHKMFYYRGDIINKKPNLQNISLDSPSVNVPLCDEFGQLPKLMKLTLFGGITKVENDTLAPLNTTTLQYLGLLSTQIKSLDVLAFSHLPYIDTIDLHGNTELGLGQDLSRSWYGLRNSSIRVLDLRNIVEEFDYITYTISSDFFMYLNQTKLKELYLDVNGLVEIKTKLHFELPHLEKLSLSYNRFLDNIAKILLDVYHLDDLYYLDLSNQSRYPIKTSNNVGNRDDHNIIMFMSPKLRYLDLSAAFPAAYNVINNVILFTTSHYMTLLDVSDNKIGQINGNFIISPPHSFYVEYFNFSHCGINHLSHKIQQTSLSMGVADLSYNDLGSQISADINGSSLRQVQLARGKELNIAANNIKNIPANFFSQTNSLERITINNNALNSWDCSLKHMTNLTYLDLSRNLLTSLTDKSFNEFEHMAKSGVSKNLSIDLSENPFECQCYTLSFLRWLAHTEVNIINKDKYECHRQGVLVSFKHLNKIINQMTIECSSRTWVTVTGVACVCLILMLAMSAVVYRHRWDIRYCMLRFQRQKNEYCALENQRDYEYDAFVAYHNNDLAWVAHQLIVNLEERPNPFKLCVHHRNWIPGPTIEENICQSVENSRKTIVVLSRKLMESGWCEFEIEMARVRGFDEGQQVIVVVALEDIPLKEMNRTLANLRRSNTWLDWFEHENDPEQFWYLLRQALRHPNSV